MNDNLSFQKMIVLLTLMVMPFSAMAQQQKNFGQSNVPQFVQPLVMPHYVYTSPATIFSAPITPPLNPYCSTSRTFADPNSYADAVISCWVNYWLPLRYIVGKGSPPAIATPDFYILNSEAYPLPFEDYLFTTQVGHVNYYDLTYTGVIRPLNYYEINNFGNKGVLTLNGSFSTNTVQIGVYSPDGVTMAPNMAYAGCNNCLNVRIQKDMSCPSNSTGDVLNASCECNIGYVANPAKTSCIPAQPPQNFSNKKSLDNCQCQSVGDPIFPLTGTMKRKVSTGISIAGNPLVLNYDTTRNAIARANGISTEANGQMNSFGALWSSTFHRSLQSSVDKTVVNLHRGDGTVLSFTVNPSTIPANTSTVVYASESGVKGRLYKVNSGWEYFDGSNLEMYDQYGRLVKLQDALGRVSNLTYSTTGTATSVAPAPDYLIGITDFAGRSVRFNYAVPARGTDVNTALVSSIVDQAGLTTSFTYDVNGSLIQITFVDGSSQRFTYANSAYPKLMTSVVDELGNTVSSYGYDSNGNAVSTSEAGGVNSYSVAYGATTPSIAVSTSINGNLGTTQTSSTWLPASSVVVTAPNGASATWSSTTPNGLPLLAGASQPAGSGTPASNKASTFDANGNLTSFTDFNGHMSCFTYDGLNRVTQSVTNLPSGTDCTVSPSSVAKARTLNTVWDPVYNIVMSETDSNGSKTVTTYNGMLDQIHGTSAYIHCAPTLQYGIDLDFPSPSGSPNTVSLPLPCERAVYPLLANGVVDTSISPRIEKYTYDSNGSVTTYIDANGHTTTYGYSANGDLVSVTDASGGITTNTSFDPYGRVLTSIDSRGVKTTYSYTPRGQIETITVSATGLENRVITNSYNAAGDLLSTTYPDGTVSTQTYDVLHRVLTSKNALGNVVTYVYDVNSNVISESYANSAGVVQKTITRVYDSLNRLQQVTGAQQ